MQDRYGYIWASTLGGINCYNGKEVTFFDKVHAGSRIMPKSICRYITSDTLGNLYFGFENCLAKFDYRQRKLLTVPAFENEWVYEIFVLSPSLMMVITDKDWIAYNPQKNEKIPLKNFLPDSAATLRPFDITQQQNTLYFTNRSSLEASDIFEKGSLALGTCAWRISVMSGATLLAARPWLGVRFGKAVTLLRVTTSHPGNRPQPGLEYARFRYPYPDPQDKPVNFLLLTAQVRPTPSSS